MVRREYNGRGLCVPGSAVDWDRLRTAHPPAGRPSAYPGNRARHGCSSPGWIRGGAGLDECLVCRNRRSADELHRLFGRWEASGFGPDRVSGTAGRRVAHNATCCGDECGESGGLSPIATAYGLDGSMANRCGLFSRGQPDEPPPSCVVSRPTRTAIASLKPQPEVVHPGLSAVQGWIVASVLRQKWLALMG